MVLIRDGRGDVVTRDVEFRSKKSPIFRLSFYKTGGDLLFQLAQVSSALLGLTSLFGMVRGEHQRYNHQKSLFNYEL
jgi:hypothetical protein